MSGVQTHMLIGIAGGLGLARLMHQTPICAAVELCAPAGWPVLLRDASLVGGSAFLATWPDIDEGHSFIGQRVRWTVTVLVGMLLALIASRFHLPFLPDHIPPVLYPALSALCGLVVGLALIGPWVGQAVLTAIRETAGGHRRLTHSLVISLPLLAVAGGLWADGLAHWAIVPAAIAWGQVLHLVGDVVTPAGVPLLWPLAVREVRLLPEPFCRVGEALVAVAAIVVSTLLVWGAWR